MNIMFCPISLRRDSMVFMSTGFPDVSWTQKTLAALPPPVVTLARITDRPFSRRTLVTSDNSPIRSLPLTSRLTHYANATIETHTVKDGFRLLIPDTQSSKKITLRDHSIECIINIFYGQTSVIICTHIGHSAKNGSLQAVDDLFLCSFCVESAPVHMPDVVLLQSHPSCETTVESSSGKIALSEKDQNK